MEMTFCDLKNKDVINICDGRNLGNMTDLVFDTCCGKITGIIVPASKGFFNFFKANNDLFIPYNRICKIGRDIILVDITFEEVNDKIISEVKNIFVHIHGRSRYEDR